jgi:hypothetical protein
MASWTGKKTFSIETFLAGQSAENFSPRDFVIPSGARNLFFFSSAQPSERFLAPLGMTKIRSFSAAWGNFRKAGRENYGPREKACVAER